MRQFPVGKTHTGKNTVGKPLGFKTIIKPSKEAIKRHILALNHRMKKMRSYPQWKLIQELNPVIWGWSNYYRTVVSSDIYSTCDRHVWFQLQRWARRRHPRKKRSWIDAKYWKQVDGRDTFCTPVGAKLRLHRDTAIQRHEKVRGTASPYDGNLLYWSQRLKTHPMMHAKKAKLLHKQQGKCRWCELLIRDDDIVEIDHIDRDHKNNALSNLMLIHLHCHDPRVAQRDGRVCSRRLTDPFTARMCVLTQTWKDLGRRNAGTSSRMLSRRVRAERHLVAQPVGNEYRVERTFGRLKGKSFETAPMDVKRDDQVKRLDCFLSLAVRVLTLRACVLRRNVKEQEQALAGRSLDSPSATITRPMAERLVRAFLPVTLMFIGFSDTVSICTTCLSGGLTPLYTQPLIPICILMCNMLERDLANNQHASCISDGTLV